MFGFFQTVGFFGVANWVRPCSLLKYRSESLKMHFHLEKLAVVAAFAIGGMGTAYAQNGVEQLQPLVETTAHRLMIGEQVALAKWDSGKVVEDTPREAQQSRKRFSDPTSRPTALKRGTSKGHPQSR
jgi:hypothetical protein